MLNIFAFAVDGQPEVVRAFPQILEGDVRAVAAAVVKGQPHARFPLSDRVRLRGEELLIPKRVYYKASALRAACGREGWEGTVALCLGTRHHDGFLRQECATRLLQSDMDWTVPFIVQLLGEYVVEVILPIERWLQGGVGPAYRDFVADNPRYMVTLEKRAVSYWDCYCRDQYPRMQDYPGIRALSLLRNS